MITLIGPIKMIEIIVEKNDSLQRFDRFLKKYLEKAPVSLIQKNIRKKNFKINDKRAKANDIVKEGDKVTMYIKDSDFNKWRRKNNLVAGNFDLDIIYEDDNLIIMDKKPGLLTHAASKKDYGKNLVDSMTSYLIKTGQVNTRDKTFRPAVVNRLDRNTGGLVIGAKNALALRSLNKAIRENKINKYYLTIVKGKIDKEFIIDTSISKNENRNRVKASSKGSRIITEFKPLEVKNEFTVLECKLVTGKTHQIRFSLKENSTPIIGDRKYGDKKLNRVIFKKTNLHNQLLLAYKLVFLQIDGLEYLNNKEFYSNEVDDFNKIKKAVFYEL
ncbi:MAG: RluA family pseudouridine synthase [Anaerococcus sp.]|nr:RluA family pseudouridine synthase [Anaerococcus sp.]